MRQVALQLEPEARHQPLLMPVRAHELITARRLLLMQQHHAVLPHVGAVLKLLRFALPLKLVGGAKPLQHAAVGRHRQARVVALGLVMGSHHLLQQRHARGLP